MDPLNKQTPQKPVGAVMVVGAGIGGIQASLDLANSGFRVYLVEEQSAIGCIMAQLDKTFPTNDGSMCIVSPKLVEVGRHLNIDILSYGEEEEVRGAAGNFTVKIKQKPRFIDQNKCTACGTIVLRSARFGPGTDLTIVDEPTAFVTVRRTE